MSGKVNSGSLKENLRTLLKRCGVYERAKGSWIYDLYWSVADRRILDDRQKESDFYRTLLEGFQDGDLIFDVGANQGYKSDIFLRCGAKVVAVDPDRTNQEILKQKFLDLRWKKRRLVIVPKAVSDRISTETMWIDAPGSAKNTLSRKWADTLKDDDKRFGHTLGFEQSRQVETVTIEQLIIAHGSPFFIKIDVEGHELSVLRGIRRPVPYLSFEVNLPEFRREGLECIQVLAGLAPDGKFNYSADCRRGLVLDRWIEKEEISAVLDSSRDGSLEVFWNTSAQKG
ncbi:MAG: FkbM family methyltransferase [Candidatus Acidiferrales bacterium]